MKQKRFKKRVELDWSKFYYPISGYIVSSVLFLLGFTSFLFQDYESASISFIMLIFIQFLILILNLIGCRDVYWEKI